MKIAITGVAGLIGSRLAEDLSANHEVIGFDNLIGGYVDNVPESINFFRKDVKDIRKEDLEGVDIVVHSACLAHEGLSMFSPRIITENTFGISVSLLTEAIQAGVKKFVYLSSMARYGYQESVPFIEEMIPNPVDPYGIAKRSFEQVLEVMSRTHGVDYTILVPHNVVGAGQVYTDPFRNVAGIMINRMLQGKQPIIYGDGLQMRSFSDIRDVVNPVKVAMFSDVANGEVINIGPDQNFITIKELASRIASIIGFDLNPIYLDGRPSEVKFANCSADKARRILGYRPLYNLDETLTSMIEWVKERGTGKFNFNLPVEISSEITPKTWKDQSIFNG